MQDSASRAAELIAKVDERRANANVDVTVDEPRRADEADLAATGELADQRLGIFAVHRRLRAEHRNALADRGRAGGLDGRNRADERKRKARPQLRQDQGRGGIAGDHD